MFFILVVYSSSTIIITGFKHPCVTYKIFYIKIFFFKGRSRTQSMQSRDSGLRMNSDFMHVQRVLAMFPRSPP